MPPPWSRPLEIDRLSRGGAVFDFDLSLADLPRLISRSPEVGGSVRGAVRFGRSAGAAVADLTVEGAATLRCQRCLQPMQWPLRSSVRVALLASETEAQALPEEIEPMLAPEGRIRIVDLVEEEVLLALPIVPLHAEVCTELPHEPPGREQQTQQPFARLGELLSHK